MDEAADVGLDESYPELLVVEYLQSERERFISFPQAEKINITRLENKSRDEHQQDSIARKPATASQKCE